MLPPTAGRDAIIALDVHSCIIIMHYHDYEAAASSSSVKSAQTSSDIRFKWRVREATWKLWYRK